MTIGNAGELRYTPFGAFCIALLAAEWIIFGSMHFSLLEKTAAQLPNFIWESIHKPIVIFTGVAEVAVGMLLLTPSLRRYAAIGSLVLIVLLLPAMYEILSSAGTSKECVAGSNAPCIDIWLRVGLVPNNILLAICSVHLLERPGFLLFAPAERKTPPRRWLRSLPTDIVSPLTALLLLFANIAGMAAATWTRPETGTKLLWIMAFIAVGALIGFLFGVPRLNPAVQARSPLIPNTNVEAVSDWLTKILVGVGLVNFYQIGVFVDGLAVRLSRDTKLTEAFALSLIIYSFAIGVIQGYVLTRIFLAARFRADVLLSDDEEDTRTRRAASRRGVQSETPPAKSIT